MTKRILLLGGSEQQLIAIDRAKEMGYETVLCDYLEDNPGQHHADVFYLVSTTDKEAVLKVARKENVDGVVAYSSDPAAPTAAYVSQELALPGLPYDTALSFCEKHLFREFLSQNGFNVPGVTSGSPQEIDFNIEEQGLAYPLIIKPADSSGSKGVTVIDEPSGLSNAVSYAADYSRSGVIVAEEFIDRAHPHVIEAEIFVVHGEVVCWGLINSIRDDSSNPLLPSAYSYPLELPQSQKLLVKQEVSRLVEASGCESGAFNIEMVIDANDRLFFLDAGPRNGGNRLPEFISSIAGIDLVELTIKAAMGELLSDSILLDGEEGGYWGLSVLHSNRGGVFEKLELDPLAEEGCIWCDLYCKPGDAVEPFNRCNDLGGLAMFKFSSKSDMDAIMNDSVHKVALICS